MPLRLSYRPPLDWDRLLGFLALRATPGVEVVRDGTYRRTFSLGGEPGTLEVKPVAAADELELRVATADRRSPPRVVRRVRRLFDLDADPEPIRRHLERDSELRPWVAGLPGLRVPGAWDGFELVVRAIVGQQVSVKGATTITGRIAERFGAPLAVSDPELSRLAPTPRQLADAALETVGMPKARARTIRLVARAVLDGSLTLDPSDPEGLRARLVAIPGIGEWTAQYVLLRLGVPDAFPASDLGLLKSAANGGAATPRALLARAEAWRPWRAYAALVLWNAEPVLT